MSGPKIAFKAGRAFRRETTNFVDADPTKGAVILQNGEDGLLHFIWRNRATNDDEEVSVVNNSVIAKAVFIHRISGFDSVPI